MNGVAVRATDEVGQDVDFDRYASGYEDDVDRSVSFTGRNSAFYAHRKVEILEEVVRDRMGPLGGLSLLDVGCGTGTTDQVLAPCVRSLHAVDISMEMLIKAQQNVPQAHFSWYDGADASLRRWDVRRRRCHLRAPSRPSVTATPGRQRDGTGWPA